MTAYCQLLDGTKADIFNPQPEWFEIRALAHSLSSKFRWCGQSRGRITVAQHCVIVSRVLDRTANSIVAFYGLLHELDEHLLPEIQAPLKRAPEMAWFRELCEKHMAVGSQWHGLEWPWPEWLAREVKLADLQVQETEARDLTANAEWRRTGAEPLLGTIVPMSPDIAEQEFLGRYGYLNALRATSKEHVE